MERDEAIQIVEGIDDTTPRQATAIGVVLDQLTAALARAEKAEALYAKAWAECEAHRDYPTDDELGTGDPENENVNIIRMARLGTAMDDHDAARKEAGL